MFQAPLCRDSVIPLPDVHGPPDDADLVLAGHFPLDHRRGREHARARLPEGLQQSAVLDLPVLDVNRLNQPIGERSVRAAITALTGISPAKAFDLEYARLPDGSYNLRELVSIRPVEWAEWITLPVRSCDRVILTTRGEMRAPEVISAPEFARMPQAA